MPQVVVSIRKEKQARMACNVEAKGVVWRGERCGVMTSSLKQGKLQRFLLWCPLHRTAQHRIKVSLSWWEAGRMSIQVKATLSAYHNLEYSKRVVGARQPLLPHTATAHRQGLAVIGGRDFANEHLGKCFYFSFFATSFQGLCVFTMSWHRLLTHGLQWMKLRKN